MLEKNKQTNDKQTNKQTAKGSSHSLVALWLLVGASLSAGNFNISVILVAAFGILQPKISCTKMGGWSPFPRAYI